ncbi:hypothetical protein DIE07_07225 [Burkholderia sp. Bp9002]|nr:hypothetical protein DIE07_07225 [Burkholderia sp. Bp9002]
MLIVPPTANPCHSRQDRSGTRRSCSSSGSARRRSNVGPSPAFAPDRSYSPSSRASHTACGVCRHLRRSLWAARDHQTRLRPDHCRRTRRQTACTKEGAPVRVAPGMLSAEAYGVKSTVADMLRFVQANMALVHLDGTLQQAITDTHTGYFQAGPMTQDPIWEQYPHPTKLKTLLEGNSARMVFDATPVVALNPPQKPRQDVRINKTGATNGFGAYVAFVPEEQLGIVILANKNIPNDERIAAAATLRTTKSPGMGSPGQQQETQRRRDASRAWAEYMPMDWSDARFEPDEPSYMEDSQE